MSHDSFAPDRDAAPAGTDPAAWLSAVSSGLARAGLNAGIHPREAGLQLSAVLLRPGRRDTELFLDQHGNAELKWWSDPGTAPAQVTTAFIRAVTAITTMPPRL
jgi:hypothetical protein